MCVTSRGPCTCVVRGAAMAAVAAAVPAVAVASVNLNRAYVRAITAAPGTITAVRARARALGREPSRYENMLNKQQPARLPTRLVELASWRAGERADERRGDLAKLDLVLFQ